MTNNLFTFTQYHPYKLPNNEINPEFKNHNCGLILDLKEGIQDAINHFYTSINSSIPKDVTIVTVPSSNSENTDSGIKKLAQLLAKDGRIDGTSCLVRHTTIPKASMGGPRNIQVHLNSISIHNAHLVKGQKVILLDDVTTSGSSLDACEKILINAGVTQIAKVAIAQTVAETV